MPLANEHPAGTPAWFDLMTPEIEGARKFYGALFGWTFEIGPPEAGSYTMCLKNGRSAAGTGPRPKDAPYPSTWTVYLASNDVEAHAKRVKALGGQLMEGPTDVLDEGRLLVAADPTGAVFGFWQAKKHPGAMIVDEPGAMTWCEVNTRDIEKAKRFYSELLGLEARKMAAPGMTYFTLHHGEKAVAGLQQMDGDFPAGVPSHWMPYFAVADADKAAATVTAGGGKVLMKPVDSPYGRMCVVADPWDAVFSIIKLAPARPA